MFEIEPVSLGMSIAAIVAFIMPFYLHKRKQSKKQKEQFALFHQAAAAHHLNLTSLDFWRDLYGIGVDPNRGKMIYIKFEKIPLIQILDLDRFPSIMTVKKSHLSGKEPVIDYLALKITGASEVILEFYDSDIFSDNFGEWPLLQKWEKISLEIAVNFRKINEESMPQEV